VVVVVVVVSGLAPRWAAPLTTTALSAGGTAFRQSCV